MNPRKIKSLNILILLCLLLAPFAGQAQPSGGPYGPIPQKYDLPKKAVHVYYAAPDGRADASGISLEQPTTLESAIERVVTGDAIVLRGGTYRTGNLRLNQGITIQPYADERPVLKGTRVADKWETLRDHVWRTAWPTLFPAKPDGWWQREREGMRTPLYLFNNDMVFIDGEPLRAKGWAGELDEHSYFIDYETGHVYIGADPANRLVEITAFDDALIRTTADCHGKTSDGKGPVIRGIAFTQYAFRALEVQGREAAGPADPSTFGKDVTGTTLENVTISNCSRVAGYFHGDGFTMRHCLVENTSTEGVYLIGSADCLLEKNIFARNNVENITGYFPAAVKIFNQCYRVTCRDNLVIDNPNSNGIWYDVGNVDGVFVNNWVQDALVGFFYEISKGAVCAGNVFVDCGKGVWALNSSNVRVYHNTFVNTVASFGRTDRSAVGDHFGWHPATGPDVDKRDGHVFSGNLLTADESFHGPLLEVTQSKVLCGKLTLSQMRRLDGNVYVRSAMDSQPLIAWSPAENDTCSVSFDSPEDLRASFPQYETDSRYLNRDLGSVFNSPELGNYGLIHSFPESVQVGLIPAEILKLLGWTKKESRAPGAFPLRP